LVHQTNLFSLSGIDYAGGEHQFTGFGDAYDARKSVGRTIFGYYAQTGEDSAKPGLLRSDPYVSAQA